jgi:hypothetical protein
MVPRIEITTSTADQTGLLHAERGDRATDNTNNTTPAKEPTRSTNALPILTTSPSPLSPSAVVSPVRPGNVSALVETFQSPKRSLSDGRERDREKHHRSGMSPEGSSFTPEGTALSHTNSATALIRASSTSKSPRERGRSKGNTTESPQHPNRDSTGSEKSVKEKVSSNNLRMNALPTPVPPTVVTPHSNVQGAGPENSQQSAQATPLTDAKTNSSGPISKGSSGGLSLFHGFPICLFFFLVFCLTFYSVYFFLFSFFLSLLIYFLYLFIFFVSSYSLSFLFFSTFFSRVRKELLSYQHQGNRRSNQLYSKD